MIIGSPEHEAWWKDILIFFAWCDHYMSEFGESPYLMTNKHMVRERKLKEDMVNSRRRFKGYPHLS